MYFDNLEDVKKHANEVICFYSDNNPYVKYDLEKEFADKASTKQVIIKNGGHLTTEFGYTEFKELLEYL